MDEELRYIELDDSLDEAEIVGSLLSEPSVHFSKIFALLTNTERRKLIRDAYDSLRDTRSRTSLSEFVGSFLEDYARPSYDDSGWKDEDESDQLELATRREITIEAIIDGNDPRGLATVLANTTLSDFETTVKSAGVEALLSRVLAKNILSAEQAAAIASCAWQNELRVRTFETDADVALADASISGDRRLETRAEEFNEKLRLILEACERHLSQQANIVIPDSLVGRFCLETTENGIYIPNRQRVVIAHDLKAAIERASQDKESLLKMSPSGFEDFMSEVFKLLGYEVEQTHRSRDGGADILCMRQMEGYKIRLAVEVKRYKESKKIDVSLVRSFVGSNMQFGADKLIYITTSSYTRPAIDYAERYAKRLLYLKQYDQIREWCEECLRKQPPQILGPNSTMFP